MANLKSTEKRKLEGLLRMRGGYVLDPHFNNRTFAEFFDETVRRNIDDAKYCASGDSKANRMRGFWKEESNHLVGKLLGHLFDFMEAEGIEHDPDELAQCRAIAARLQADRDVVDIDVLGELGEGRDFDAVAQAARDAIERNEPASGLDRLHTFMTKYLRTLCAALGVQTDRNMPLNSVMGLYRNKLRALGTLESGMADRILKSSIDVLEHFNGVRNDQSLAHDNPMLNHEEAMLIYGHVTSTVRFLRELEKRFEREARAAREAEAAAAMAVDPDADIPF